MINTRRSIRLDVAPRRSRWILLLLPHLVLTLVLLAFSQLAFLGYSLHADLGDGMMGTTITWDNYAALLQDPIYLSSLRLTIVLSAVSVLISLLISYPVAYSLARLRGDIASLLLTAVVGSSFVSIAIKILGLVIIFSADGPLSRFFRWLGVISGSLQLLGTRTGVIFGYVHLSVSFMVVMLFAVIQTIPTRLEEAAAVHGASRLAIYRRVILPLSLPGATNATLIQFNLLIGAFITASILGGGKVVTIPVLIQRTLTLFNNYGAAAALSAVLLAVVLLINMVAGFGLAMPRRGTQA